ncbi:hypothetical protein T310_0848 [Rasamsonia emersonii CBS 393.64]|uniref:Uncharacterized protein n=1 Tax=Rasamsonia emersonii (strain ATCC 16479 / CBS 393.64 / IMI 116815) TaxID=1408163 RepID=A0A0F4Z5K5_RASE3|nr:hypothetical protein T310_0848 [Rasamsonia emersonii CBS 393.64]KKA25143.1 hypothetical protein T310_0848 [Rasamsonia emersonii CBS 393.64]
MSHSDGPGTTQESNASLLADGRIASMDTRVDAAADPSTSVPGHRRLSTFERVFSTHAPIFESLLLQIPTDTIFQLYHTSSYLRKFLQSYPTAWKYLSFRLLYPSGSQTRPLLPGSPDPATQRQSRPYALDQLLMMVVVPLSPCLRSLELDNTAVSGQILISTVLHSRRETLEHLSVRGCKNVSLKYHIIPYLTMFGLQYDVDMEKNPSSSPAKKKLALKSLYTYRCRHHRRRPYLSSSLLRRDSDSEPTHELVNLCHKLGIWTDTAWCTTPAGRCFRRRGYVSMRVPHGSPEVWVVFDRLWRSKNWLGSSPDSGTQETKRDGRLWEHDETGFNGEPLGTGDRWSSGEGKMVPAHLRQSHRRFVENIKCDQCFEDIPERCEQCSVLMHCVGCRKTLCASCAYDRPYHRPAANSTTAGAGNSLWWAPGATISPCLMQEPPSPEEAAGTNPTPAGPNQYPALKFHWCCTEPIFSGGGGISIGTTSRDVDLVRAAPLPRGQGFEDPEYSPSEWCKNFPRYAYGDPKRPDYSLKTGHMEMMRWLLGPPGRQVSTCPRNLCQECYDSPQWKVNCKSCSKPLCMEHDLRGLRLRICGYRDLALEKMSLQNQQASAGSRSGGSIGLSITFCVQQYCGGARRPEHDGNASRCPARIHRARGRGPSTRSAGWSEPLPNQLEPFTFFIPFVRVLRRCCGNPQMAGLPVIFLPSVPASWRPTTALYERAARVHELLGSRLPGLHQEEPSLYLLLLRGQLPLPELPEIAGRGRHLPTGGGGEGQKEEKWKKDMEMLEDILERKLANEVAEFAGQFMGLVQGRDGTDQGQAQAQTQTQTDGNHVRAEEMFEHPMSDEEAVLEEMMTPIAD